MVAARNDLNATAHIKMKSRNSGLGKGATHERFAMHLTQHLKNMKHYLSFALIWVLGQGTAQSDVIINEILAHSHDAAPDWIELYNNGSEPVNLEGWHLSDSKNNAKYTIPSGVLIEPHGYLIFMEDETFGATNGIGLVQNQPFALSEHGETVYLTSPMETIEQTMGPTSTSVSMGRYENSLGVVDFVAMASPTPGSVNSRPLVGPLVITEIMYHPLADGDAEYTELMNVSDSTVTLFDEHEDRAWRFTDGITFKFPSTDPLVLRPGERFLLTRDAVALQATFTLPGGIAVVEWDSGGLNNFGERLELSRPGDVDTDGVRHWILVDSVTFSNALPWPEAADGLGASLGRSKVFAYGDDLGNWMPISPTPGYAISSTYHEWVTRTIGDSENSSPWANPDSDDLMNLLEYVFETDPLKTGALSDMNITLEGNQLRVRYGIAVLDSALMYHIEQCTCLATEDWIQLETSLGETEISTTDENSKARSFYRLSIAPQTYVDGL